MVTGANGFLGRHVARLFAQKGFEVLGIGHGEWAREKWTEWGLSDWHCADVTLKSLQRYGGKPTAILHCAGSGSVGFSIQDPLADFQRTVATTAHVLEYVRLSAPCARVVYPSSASVYGVAAVLPIPEGFRTVPISQYGVHKLMAEQVVASFARQFGIPASIVRLFSVYGCGLRKQLLWDACRKFAAGDMLFMGTGDEVRDWLHVEDAAQLMLAAARNASAECPTVNGDRRRRNGAACAGTTGEVPARSRTRIDFFRCSSCGRSGPIYSGRDLAQNIGAGIPNADGGME